MKPWPGHVKGWFFIQGCTPMGSATLIFAVLLRCPDALKLRADPDPTFSKKYRIRPSTIKLDPDPTLIKPLPDSTKNANPTVRSQKEQTT